MSKPEIPDAVLGPMTGLDWPRHFERFAEKLAGKHQARTGYPLPASDGLAVEARTQSRSSRKAA